MTEKLKEYAEGLPERRQSERRKGWGDFHSQLAGHADRLEIRLLKFFSKSLAVFAIIGITSAGALLGFGIVLKNQKQYSKDIQKQRYTTLLENCQAQNARHDRAILRAEALLPADELKAATVLVDELQPRTPDCVDYARSHVRGS